MEDDKTEQQHSIGAHKDTGELQADSNELLPVAAVLSYLGLKSSPSGSDVDQLLAQLKHPHWSRRVEAVRELAKLKEHGLVTRLVSLLQDSHEAVRAAAARELGELQGEAPLAALVAAARDAAWVVRAAAIIALGKRGIAPGSVLSVALQDEDEAVRASAVWALGTRRDADARALLSAALHDPSWMVQEAATLALGEYDSFLSLEPLLSAKVDEDSPAWGAAQHIYQRPSLPLSSPLVAGPGRQPAIDQRERKATESQDKRKSIRFPVSKRKSGSLTPEHTRYWSSRTLSAVRIAVAAIIVVGIGVGWSLLAHIPHSDTGSPIQTFFIHQDPRGAMYRVAWSPSARTASQQLVFVGAEGIIQAWNPVTEQQIWSYNGHFSRVLALTWSTSGVRAVAIDTNGEIQVIEIQPAGNDVTAQALFILPFEPSLALVKWSPDGSRLAVARVDGSVEIWDSIGKKMVSRFMLEAPAQAIAWQQGGKDIAVASFVTLAGKQKSNAIQLFLVATGLPDPAQHPFPTTRGVAAMGWSPDDTSLVYEMTDGTVELLLYQDRQSHITLYTPDKPPVDQFQPFKSAISWSPDGKQFAVALPGGIVKLWDTLGALRTTYTGHGQSVNDLGWSPDGRYIASASNDSSVQVWAMRG